MKILFICHANICRSFMAQELLRPLLPDDTVFSRGLYADASYRVPAKVTDFLQKNGIVPPPHTSTQLAKADLEQADLIFFMEQAHLDKISDRYAQYLDKMWLLNDYAFGREQDLDDPISLSGRAFEKSAERLKKAVAAVAEKLQANA